MSTVNSKGRMQRKRMPDEYQGVNKIAERLGITDNAVRQRVDKGLFPQPDVVVETGTKKTPGWSAQTIEEYITNNEKKEN